MKKCKCGETDLTMFGKDVNKPDKLKIYCRKCHNAINTKLRAENRERYRKTNLAYARSPEGKAKQRSNNLRRKFWPHLTNEQAVAEYERILTEQGRMCALCDRPEAKMKKAFDVDHCHETGVIRGLLCNPCNRVVVQNKTVEKIKKIYAYFKKYHIIEE